MSATLLERPAPAAPAPLPPQDRSRSERWLVVLGIGLPTLLILFIMMGFIEGVVTSSSDFPFINVRLRAPQLLVANTPTGGDMGAHVLLPQVLRDSLLPSGRILGWSNAWYAGFPVLYFYFPLPALVTVLLDLVLPYGVALKLVTIVGLVAFPGAVYFFVRSMGFSRSVASLGAATGAMYVFMESFSIYGGNVKSTLAGEYSFAWSLSLSLWYLGLVIRDTREGRKLSPWAAVALALTAMSHIIPTMVVIVASLPLLLRKRGIRVVTTAWGLGFAISAFWSLPLLVRVMQGMTTSMDWNPVKGLVGQNNTQQIVTTTLPDELVPIFVLAVIGAVWALLRRDDVSALLTMTVVPAFVYWLLGVANVTEIYNGRFLPYWFVGLFILAGITIGLGITSFSRLLSHRGQNIALFGGIGIVMLFATTSVAIHDLPGWVGWNYSGYEGRQVYDGNGDVVEDRWAELEGLMATLDTLPPGRVMWEANGDMDRYGTPMALMLTGYFSPEHPSMEGLFFESSLTTPFHFLNAAEVSDRPSNPKRGLPYRQFDLDRGATHLAVYDVRYYVSFTERATDAARENERYTEVGQSPPWTIFELPESGLIDVATHEPVVYEGELNAEDWGVEWYDYTDPAELDRWLVAEGPESWARVVEVADRMAIDRPYNVTGAEVSDVVLEDDRIEFTTNVIGVPHLIKVSYFPNWEVQSGAEGPFRAAPSLMVVVPTEERVVLEFARKPPEILGNLLTLAGIVIVARWVIVDRRRRRHASAVGSAAPGASGGETG